MLCKQLPGSLGLNTAGEETDTFSMIFYVVLGKNLMHMLKPTYTSKH